MARYKNGGIPAHLLIHMGGEHWATAGTKAKIDALIADIWKTEGVRVWVTSGPNIYRDLANQKFTKRYFISIGKGWQAAYPGTSSHGGEFEGKDALAVDFSGYGTLGIGKWYAYLRKHGFEAGYFNGKNGRPYEPWHAIDWEPYRKVAAPTSTPSEPAVVPEEDEDDMSTIRYVHRAEPGYATEWMIVGMELPGGFETTTDETTAVGWGAIYGTDKGDSWKALNRKQYITLQENAAKRHKRWVEMQKAIRS